ncbi:MAG: hypothetical protein U0T73_05405 [Chitinophagales bacterium]
MSTNLNMDIRKTPKSPSVRLLEAVKAAENEQSLKWEYTDEIRDALQKIEHKRRITRMSADILELTFGYREKS